MNFTGKLAALTAFGILGAMPVLAVAQGSSAAGVPLPAASAAPQAPGHPMHHAHHERMMRLLHSLDLTEVQKAQIKSLMQTFRQQNMESADPATRRANFDKLQSDIRNVLTPAQRAKLDEELKKMRAERRDRAGTGALASPPPTPSAAP